ncbi:CaiB/BaiF CoA transferase family protein [Roseomonas xinghualingensis]|uniref:CaiB/BaiF CoA transferase family protein n=1 Tax=Roseomonas xinghualingensis TaxID=2986475 RepID=UPI0021F0CAAE|nr:CoA transferase [Roseomonas sp. SXEYE001]MCV4206957.1 CoA transferase [Roseomonas sp. SXEYE001]
MPPAGPLAGIRVLDCSSVVMGPYAARLLADQGAEVLKVEPPEGDVLRRAGQGGAMFAHLNRGKRAVALDLKAPEGQAALRRLAAGADVLLHNMRADAATRLGLRREALREVNPRLIVASAVGYGAGGPYEARPAYDDLIQAASGLADIMGRVSPDGEPRYVPLTLSDRVVGIQLAQAITAALFARERGAEGTEIEVPMFETFADLVLGDHLGWLSFEPPRGGPHYPRLMTPQRRPYRTRDGHIAVLLYNDAHWHRFFRAVGREAEMEADPRLRDHAGRTVNFHHAYGMVGEILAERGTAEWLRLLCSLDIPAAPVNGVEALLEDPHLHAVGFWREAPLPNGGTLRSTAPVGRWAGQPETPLRPPPELPGNDPEEATWISR